MPVEIIDSDTSKGISPETEQKSLPSSPVNNPVESSSLAKDTFQQDDLKDNHSDDDWVKEPEDYPPLDSEKSILDSVDTRAPVKEADEDGWLDILGNGQLKKKIIRPGEGVNTRPQRGNLVIIRCEGCLDTGKIVDCHDELKFTLGDGDTIQAFDLCVALMEKGEFSEVMVHPRFAYGEIGNEPEIPSNAHITYQVEILDVQPEVEIESLTFAQRQKLGDEKRDRGNYWYSREEYTLAIGSYRRALEILDDENKSHDDIAENLQQLLETRLKVYNNLGAAQMKIDAYDAALKSIEFVLRVQPNNVKAMFRKGKILAIKGETKEAMECLRKALKFEPESKIIHMELSKLSSKVKSEVQFEKEMYKRMLGTEKNDLPVEESKPKYKKWGLIVGAIVAAIIGTVVYKYL